MSKEIIKYTFSLMKYYRIHAIVLFLGFIAFITFSCADDSKCCGGDSVCGGNDLIGCFCDGDADDDEIPDEEDNCPCTANTAQSDVDGNGIGDVCQPVE